MLKSMINLLVSYILLLNVQLVAASKNTTSSVDVDDERLKNIVECNLLSGVVTFTALFIPCAFMLLIRCIQNRLERPAPVSGYEEVDNPQNIKNSSNDVQFAGNFRFFGNILFFVPSILCAAAFGAGSWYLCKFIAVD